MTTVSSRGAGGIRLSEADAAKMFDDLPSARLRDSGVHQIAITDEVVLTADRGLAALSFVRFLREATSVGVWVSWWGTVDLDLDPELLCHLPPPSSDSADSGLGEPAAGTAWRAGHEAGLCYYRLGPGFVQVTDRRPGAPPRRVVLNAQPRLDLFASHLVPGPVSATDTGDARSEAYRELVRGRLLLRIGNYAVTLPHRLLCRPVPWNVF
ncbi:MAG TPA: DUF5825 family protein [Streptosporangiaceae bacterium]|nr:DUF5825 family protein [Streptosporangiaceae bacterium]